MDYEQPQKYLVESENYTKTGTPVLTAGKSFVLGFTTEKQGICKLVPVIIFDDFTTASRYVDFSFKVKSSAVKLLRPRNKDFDIRYIYAQMQHVGYVPGMHQRHWIGIYSYFNIPIPSLDEQRRIVGLLARLDEAIAETQGLIEKYRNVKRGMMHDLLTCGIDARGNIRSPRTHRFKPSPLGMIPEEWECVDLGTLYDLKAGTTPNRSEVRYFDADGILWVKTLDLNEEYITDTEEKVSEYALQMNSLTIHPAGTVLLAMYGGWLQIGRTAILARPATTNQAIVALTPKRDNCIPSEFTQYFLQIYRKRWRKHAISTRKDPNISKRDIMQFAFAYPKSHDEQEAICRKIKGCSALIAEQENTAKKLAELRTGLMHDLLSGKVRIPSSDSHIDCQ